MKIQEFRELMKKCNREDVEKIASELYKMMPKSRKENEIDPLIQDIISGKAAASSVKNKKTPVDFETLKKEIDTFLDYVDKDYYYMPNRVVSKVRRSKWRFEVKNFIKMINEIPVDGENGKESVYLLREIYKRLSYGCGYYIFPSEDPFASIGMRQPVYYEMMIKRTFATGYTDENMKNMLLDATCVEIDRNSLHIEMEKIFAESLPTSDLKYKAIELIKEYVEEFEDKLKKSIKNSNESYRLKCSIEEMCETMLIISILLCEPEDAIKYYWEHDKESNPEVTLYKLLDTIDDCGDDKLWISAYEESLSKKIMPRDRLKELYAEKKASRKQ